MKQDKHFFDGRLHGLVLRTREAFCTTHKRQWQKGN